MEPLEGLRQDVEEMAMGEMKLVPHLDGTVWRLWKRPGRWVLTPAVRETILVTPEAAGTRVGNP